jgi:hypothetical protein
VRQRGPHHSGGAQQVDRDDSLPLVGGYLTERAAGVDPGGGEYCLQLVTTRGHQRRDSILGGDPVGQVSLHVIHIERWSIAVENQRAAASG